MINKKIFLVSFIFILIVVVATYSFIVKEKNVFIPDVVETPLVEIDNKINNIVAGEDGRIMFVPHVVKFSDCEKIKEGDKKECLNQAYTNESAVKDNLVLCLKIDDYEKRSRCIYNGVRDFYSIQSCKRIPSHEFQAVCIQDASIATRYIDFCNFFDGEPHEMQECQDRTNSFNYGDKGLINKCSEITTLEYKNLCFQNTGTTCEKITDREDRDQCISFFEYSKANDLESCSKLPNDTYRRTCFEKIKDYNKGKDASKIDTDNDGLWDEKELWINTNPFSADTDGDGLTDYQEAIEKIGGNPVSADTDQDGLTDYEEVQLGTSVQRPDTDGDGVWDSADKDPLSGDSDNDRLDDVTEALWGTDPNKKDTDGDGLSDYEEIKNGKNPLGEGWKSDTDGDGLLDIDEIFYLTDAINPDTDGDGVNDKEEIEAGTNPLGEGDFDFDGDRLSDKEELELGTNPYKSDSNDDGITDFEAVRNGIDPTSNDTDSDGLNNLYEIKNGLDPLKSDTDGDGLSDGDEVNKYGTDPNNIDTDGDGFLDGEEVQAGFDPRVNSGV